MPQITDDTPEDYATLWSWISFDWVVPLLRTALARTALSEDDIYPLSPIMKARPLYIKFSHLSGGLLKRILHANSRDMIIDFTFTYASIVLGYAGPFFLKHILDALDNTRGEPGREARAIAFVYAIAAFACSLLKTQADLQHLYFGRRVGTRVRTELMVVIYDKALKRKNFSGVTRKEDGRNNASNAGSGQVLNLMSADVTLVSNTVSAVYMVYRSKLELYQAYSGPDQYSSAI